MKRTLFLALAFGLTLTPASAYIGTDSSVNVILGNETLTEDLNLAKTPGFKANSTHVGTHAGDGRLELAENVTLTLPNAFMIGGKGYGLAYTNSGSGVVIVNKGAVINVGASTHSSGGHHVDVGNSAYDCTGELYVKGGTVNATQLVIGMGATGTVAVSEGGTINLSRDGVTGNQIGNNIGAENGGHFGHAALTFDKGNFTDNRATYDFVGYTGVAAIELNNGSVWDSNSDLYLGTDHTFDYTPEEASGRLSISADSTFSNNYIYVMDNGTIDNAGELHSGSMDVYEGALHNAATGTVGSEEIDIGTRGLLTNCGKMEVGVLVSTAGGSITNATDGNISYTEAYSEDGSTLVNHGTMAGEYLEITSDGSVENSGNLSASDTVLVQNATLLNKGSIDAGQIVLQNQATLTTGFAVVSGCESQMAQTHDTLIDYSSGLSAETAVYLDAEAGESVTVGAYVSGKDTMQYLYSEDFRKLNAAILGALSLKASDGSDHSAADGIDVKIANIVGENIAANVTTDEACKDGAVTVALSGSNLVVRVGDNGASAPTAEDKKASAEKVGTLGSYNDAVSETDATVRLHTSATDSSVSWEGHSMQTVSGETSTVNDTTRVSVGSDGVEGTLTVVEDSTLQNHGTVSSDKVVVNGTMDNNGTISAATTVNGTLKGSGVMAATTIAETATLIVGNSPGYSTFTDALTVQSGASVVFSVAGLATPASLTDGKGWESHTYSQIVMENGAAVTLCDGVNITIAFGGDELCSALTPLHEEQLHNNFELVLIKGGVAPSLDLVSLMDHTSFVISDEAGALPLVLTGQSWVLNVSNAEYFVNDGNLVLRGSMGIARTPEPATATLSLLAMAALAARSKRN